MDREKAIKAIEQLLEALGEDTSREGLKDTPRRVADAFAEFVSGENACAEEHLSKTFVCTSGDMVLEKDIAFSSTCEHHLMPFFGKIAIAYIPDGKVVGLSKLARTVEVFSKRLQLQEHTCMTCRGVKKFGSKTLSYSMAGNFPEDKKREVLALLK